jgi:hypothetical protein
MNNHYNESADLSSTGMSRDINDVDREGPSHRDIADSKAGQVS